MVKRGLLVQEAGQLNEAFNHWIQTRTPLVTVKAAMTLDGKIATPGGESKWITGNKARAWGIKLRQGARIDGQRRIAVAPVFDAVCRRAPPRHAFICAP